MNVAVVDDENLALKNMEERLGQVQEIREITSFYSSSEALAWLQENTIDIAFLDINLGGMDGLTLAKRLKEIQPQCAVVFVTGYSEYAVEAYEIHASGYLMKPVSAEAIRKEIENILYPPKFSAQSKKAVQIQCFGNFEVYVHGEPMKFRYSKTKELLAYLIDRNGAMVEMGQLCAVLWEDKPYSVSLRSQLRNSISDLTYSMKMFGIRNLLVKQKNYIAVNVEVVDCDYFRFLRMESAAINIYRGEYMVQYSWAEMTLGGLERMKIKE